MMLPVAVMTMWLFGVMMLVVVAQVRCWLGLPAVGVWLLRVMSPVTLSHHSEVEGHIQKRPTKHHWLVVAALPSSHCELVAVWLLREISVAELWLVVAAHPVPHYEPVEVWLSREISVASLVAEEA